MSQITMDIPVLVRQLKIEGKQHYQFRPLFFSYPNVTERRYEKAVESFRREMKFVFQHLELSRQTLPSYLWYRFNPNLKYEVKPFEFDIGKQYVRANFGYATFDMGEKKFAFFPNFNNFMCILSKNDKDKYSVETEVTRVLTKLLRNIKRNAGGGSIDFTAYTSDKSEFKSVINCTVKLESQGFPFEKDAHSFFFAAFGGSTEFDGATELYKVGYDLNEKYPTGLLSAWYREDLVKRIYELVFSEEKTPLVLVGKEGVGKKSVLHEALYRYIGEIGKTGDAEPEHQQKIWQVDPTRVISGMSIVGSWQKRFEAILKYIKNRRSQNKKIKDTATDKILFDNAVALLRIGKSSQNSMTLGDVLKTYMEKRLLQVILLATPEEWKIVQQSDRRFTDLFTVIRVDEPDKQNAVKMVLQKRKLLEVEYGSSISTQAINHLFAIHRNYFKRRALPGGVMRLLDQMAVKYKFSSIDLPEVRAEFAEYSGLQDKITDEDKVYDKNDIRNSLAVQLVGQGAAVEAMADNLHNIKAKLVDPGKPKGSFLFIGPTGVGKTQAAKVLSEFMLGSEKKLMRFDMNEFVDAISATRLIGDHNNPEGLLTGKVRYNPFGIVLLDEIEKAHPKVHDLLLQVLDDGRLSDSLGRTVDFSNTIIIMTSNIGADQVSSRVGFGHIQTEVDAVYRKAVENHFRPEFVNRIDKIVIFQPLQQQHILGIARLQINELLKRDGFVRRTTILNISEEALDWVARRGFDSRMGGRALKRQIEKDLTALSANQLLDADSDIPVILDIILKDGQLVPKITPLEFAETLEESWLPNLPEEKKGKKFYGNLLRVIERLEKEIQAYEQLSIYDDEADDDIVIAIDSSKATEDWQYYDFKDRLINTKEKVQETMIGFRDNFFRGGPAIPLRLKGGGLGSYIQKSDVSTKGYRQLLKDKLFQEEALSELNEHYRLASEQFDSLNTEFIDNYLDVCFFALHSRGFLAGKPDEITIKYSSCIDGKGMLELNFLMDLHKRYFEEADIQFEFNEQAFTIMADAYSLYPLFKGERGIHLFYRTHQTPLPIRVEITKAGEKMEFLDMKVIRLYDLNATLSDLRSGFSNDVQITPKEFKLLLFAGLEGHLRKYLMRQGN